MAVTQKIQSGESRVLYCDALRGLAAMVVMLAHLVNGFIALDDWLWNPDDLSDLYNGWLDWFFIVDGAYGVALFFLISGYVIPMSLSRSGVKAFLVARIFRLYPVYIFCSLILLCIVVWFGIEKPSGHLMDKYLANITFFRDWIGMPPFDGIVWTLEVEAKYYLFAGLMFALCGIRVFTLLIPAFLCVLLYVTGYEAASPIPYGLSFEALLWAFSYISFMQLGTFVYLYERGSNSVLFLALFGITICASVFLIYKLYTSLSVVGYYVVALITFLAASKFRAAPIWEKVPLFFARISYPLYAVHTIGYSLLSFLNFHLGMPAFLALLLVISVVIFLSYLIHRYVEVPSLRYGKRMSTLVSERIQWKNLEQN